jgi:hypothetical protein
MHRPPLEPVRLPLDPPVRARDPSPSESSGGGTLIERVKAWRSFLRSCDQQSASFRLYKHQRLARREVDSFQESQSRSGLRPLAESAENPARYSGDGKRRSGLDGRLLHLSTVIPFLMNVQIAPFKPVA